MKKFLALLLIAMLIGGHCFAAVSYTVTSRDRYTDDQGNNVVRVRGTIAMDNAYPCDSSSGACGYKLIPQQLGMNSISQINISPAYSANVSGGSVVTFKYESAMLTPVAGAAHITSSGIRGYYSSLVDGASGTHAGGFKSLPSYNLSDITALPFEAIGA